MEFSGTGDDEYIDLTYVWPTVDEVDLINPPVAADSTPDTRIKFATAYTNSDGEVDVSVRNSDGSNTVYRRDGLVGY
jgi:hypothetical protein